MADVDEAAVERDFEAEFGEESQELRRSEDVLLMRKVLLNEKAAPEILDFEQELVDNLKALLREQEETIARNEVTVRSSWRQTVLQMELDRVKYLVVEYLRVRLRKIHAFTLHILGDAEVHSRLSKEELSFAKEYIDLDAEHLRSTALDKMPKAFQSITTQTQTGDMVASPDLDSYVFCRVERTIGDAQFDDGPNAAPVSLIEGDLLAIRYKPIRGLVQNGDVVLV
mmetsp:Transcript_10778/g.19033  ORF Transcript_10778/g.19033 Transcript_10778/m.19033 type:complete len:226 (+) Transcript_10778:190-867(+)|eukprot:CAMPEP_0184512094 /NCGR_PEP_ID=MMETSP0198_2-20121128/2697_1 /TAXON_ID=1112570 /ORGANISM="Thraustochytrium sp., Strain LLF1b" /LENGTH=225 /DNA_ID=CAMNT_0026902095 /DNA_START=159 /DNA_END=836 /DNA_ORIENTATION=+